MSRRIALAVSFALTVVVTFAVASFASQAHWLEAKSDQTETAVATQAPEETSGQEEAVAKQEPVIVTEYVYVDVPVERQQPAAPAATASPSPQPSPPQAQAGVSQASGSDGPPTSALSRREEPTAAHTLAPSSRTLGDREDDAEQPDDDEHEHEQEHETEHEDDD